MFTGIIQATGTLATCNPAQDGLQLTIHSPALGMDDVALGDSIAVNGVCLTVIAKTQTGFNAHVSAATLAVTTGFALNQSANLEKALRLSDRLGGHLVSGHVDGIGKVTELTPVGDDWRLAIEAPRAISKFIAIKGSICINGVSLTVNHIANDIFHINLIPHTWENTTLNELQVGSAVNIEIDQIARYVARMAEWEHENT